MINNNDRSSSRDSFISVGGTRYPAITDAMRDRMASGGELLARVKIRRRVGIYSYVYETTLCHPMKTDVTTIVRVAARRYAACRWLYIDTHMKTLIAAKAQGDD